MNGNQVRKTLDKGKFYAIGKKPHSILHEKSRKDHQWMYALDRKNFKPKDAKPFTSQNQMTHRNSQREQRIPRNNRTNYLSHSKDFQRGEGALLGISCTKQEPEQQLGTHQLQSCVEYLLPKFWIKYVQVVLAIVKKNEIDEVFNKLNKV